MSIYIFCCCRCCWMHANFHVISFTLGSCCVLFYFAVVTDMCMFIELNLVNCSTFLLRDSKKKSQNFFQLLK